MGKQMFLDMSLPSCGYLSLILYQAIVSSFFFPEAIKDQIYTFFCAFLKSTDSTNSHFPAYVLSILEGVH